MSRIGAAIGTFLLPIGLEAWGTGPAMAITGAVCLAGLVVSIPLATETRNLTLAEAGSVDSEPARTPA